MLLLPENLKLVSRARELDFISAQKRCNSPADVQSSFWLYILMNGTGVSIAADWVIISTKEIFQSAFHVVQEFFFHAYLNLFWHDEAY